MIRQVLRIRILLLDDGEHRQEFENAAGPAVEEGYGDCVGALGEEGHEVDCEFVAGLVFDWGGEVGEGVYFFFAAAPVLFSI